MVLIVEGTPDLGLESVAWRIHRHTQALDMLAPARYNTVKAICGMSTRSAHTEMKSHRLRASSHTPAPNVARWKPHRGSPRS